MGLILVKELLLVDEDAGVHIRDLRLRELPFMRRALPLWFDRRCCGVLIMSGACARAGCPA